jgi:hypothetical protein
VTIKEIKKEYKKEKKENKKIYKFILIIKKESKVNMVILSLK